MVSLARQSYLRKMAGLASASHARASGAPAPAAAGPQAGDYQLMELRLRTDQLRLKALQSIEKRIELKRELLPEYAGWVQGRLDAAVGAERGVQDDVLMTVMLWRIDVGDFDGALPLAEYALRFKLQMPEPFKRGVACILTEELAEASIKLLAAGQPAPYLTLLRVHELVEGQDMPDEVRAKLFKALGLEHARLAADEAACAASGVPGAARVWKEQALNHLKRALELHAACGVKGDVKRLEKELNKPPSQDAGEETAAQT